MDDRSPTHSEAYGEDWSAPASSGPGKRETRGEIRRVTPGPDGTIALPVGTKLDTVRIEGADLRIEMPDGSILVIVDGAIVLPHLVIGDAEIPPPVLAQRLIEAEPGPTTAPPSSGGNFVEPVGPIGDPASLGDLLPPTELAFPEWRREELFPDETFPDSPSEGPGIVIVTPENPGGATDARATVDEAGLPARGPKPEGTAASTDSETSSGRIVLTGDGPLTVVIDGVVVTGVGQTIDTAYGMLTITSVADGEIGYSYTLLDNLTDNAAVDAIAIEVTDKRGHTRSGSITISILDDAPIAVDDADGIPTGSLGPAVGNVITGEGTTGGAAGADQSGADGDPHIVGIVSAFDGGADTTPDGSGNFVLEGQYGTLTINRDGGYSYTRIVGVPDGATDSFTYTLADGDGDTDVATLTITIVNGVPVAGVNAVVQLDDDALPGGNPGGPGDVSPDTANTSGFLSGLGGDGPLTWSWQTLGAPSGFTINAPVGFGYTRSGEAQLLIQQNGVTVIVVTLDVATGAYTVTQVAPVMHPPGGDENNQSFVLAYAVTDNDGDRGLGTLTIEVNDDTPVARDDADRIVSGSIGPATGNVITGEGTDTGAAGADSPGADGGAAIVAVLAGGIVNDTPDAAGNFTIAGQYGVLIINRDGGYSYTRNLGAPDGASDLFTYSLTDRDGDTVTADLTITIANASPSTTGNALVQLDDDALPGGNPGGVGDADPDIANATGTLSGDGGDGALTFAFRTDTAPAGFTYVASGNDLLVQQNGVTVVTVTLDPATGAYSVVQNAPVSHPPGDDENDVTLSLGYTVTDIDGDVATGSLIIDVDDDTPVALGASDNIAAGAFGPATGNVITGAGTLEGLPDQVGADGGGRIVAISSFATGASDTSADSSGNLTVAGQYGVLTLNQDGTYSYARDPGAPGGVTDTFTYVLSDSDGDTVSATLSINIADASPIVAANAPVQLDDDALPGGNPGGVGDADPDTANTTGTLAASGGDGALTFALQTTSAPAGFTYVASGDDLLIQQGGITVVTVTLNTTSGAYTVTQNAPVSHPPGGDENDVDFTLAYRVTDADGDSAVGNLVINVDDDTPVAINDSDTLAAGSLAPATGNVITGEGTASGLADSVGADGGGRITGISSNATNASDTTADGAGDFTVVGQYGTLTINQDGGYSYSRSGGAPSNATDVFTYVLTDGDGDDVAATLTITLANAFPVTGVNARVQLDDDALPGGNPGGVGDADPDTANTTGTLAASGGDGALTFALQTTGAPAGFAYVASGDDLLIQQGGITVVTVTLNPSTGAYTVTQNAPVSHPPGGDENDVAFTLAYRVTDSDGDSASGSLVIDVDDDTPAAVSDSDNIAAGSLGPATGNVITGVGTTAGAAGADSAGADDNGRITGILSNATGAGDTTADGAGNFVVTGQYGTLTLNQDGTYSYARAPGTSGGVSDAFTYTFMDGDGDAVSASLTINIADLAPITGANAQVQLDDDALPDGNPGGVGDVDPDTANTTGTLSASGGDGALTYGLLTTGAPAGFTYVASGADILIQQGGITVVTVTLNTATGAYTVVQNAPVSHPAGGEENDVAFTLGYRVTDADGDTATGSLVVNVNDDTPVALGASDNIAAGGFGPATGNVITGIGTQEGLPDLPGADGSSGVIAIGNPVTGASDTTADGAGNFTLAGQYGVLTLNQDGTYSYVRNPASPGGVTDAFTYTLSDGDGDTVTASLSINIGDLGPATGPNAQVQLDDDALPGGNPGGVGDVDPDTANTTGTLAGSGGDGALAFVLQTTGAPAGFTYLASGSDVLIQQGGVTVVTVTLNTTTGAYTVTQNAPVSHPLGGDENDFSFTLGYRVTDADGDSAGGSLVIQVNDDTPVAVSDSDAIAAGTFGPATGNVITGAGTTAGAAGADSAGADGAGRIVGIRSNATGASDSTPDAAGEFAIAGQYGFLTINQDGTYSYTRNAGVPGGARDMFTYSFADGDGDIATATLTIDIANAAPVVAPNAQVQLDDDALPGGNPGGVGDVDPDTANTTGTLLASGGDGALTYGLLTTGAPAGFTYVASGADILIQQGGITVVTVTLNTATGAYTVVQNAPVSHPPGGDENDAAFSLGYVVTDIDGDAATGSLVINVDDDTPIALGASDAVAAGTFGPAVGNVITGVGTLEGLPDSVGADGNGRITGIVSDATAASDITPDGSGNLVVAGQYGVLTINQDGTYSYARNAGTPGGVTDAFTYTLSDGDGDTVTAPLTINIGDAPILVGGNAAVQLDDDALPGGNPGGVGDVDPDTANTTGTLSGAGGDGALTFALQTGGAPAGFSYVASGSDILIQQAGVTVVTVTLDTATGAYTVTQNAPVAHPPGGDENDVAFTLGYVVTDLDGDSAAGALTINVDDDTPFALGASDTVPAGSLGPATGNVITGVGTLEGAPDLPGADGSGGIVEIASNATGVSDTTPDGSGNLVVAGQYGVLTINQDGTYSYARNAGTPGGVTDAFTYTLSDGDEDLTTAVLTINIADQSPSAGANALVQLDDDALPGGNPGGVGDDDPDTANTTGVLSGSGGDGVLTFALLTDNAPAGFTYLASGTDILIQQGGVTVVTVTLDPATGAYTVTQNAPVTHPAGDDENNVAFALAYTVTDADGDTTVGSLIVDVDDDTPLALGASDAIAAGSLGPATGNVITGAGTLEGAPDLPGADGSGGIVSILSNATGASDATADGAGDFSVAGQYGVLTINQDGTYSYARNAGTPGGVTDSFTYTLIDGDGDPVTAVLTINFGNEPPVVGDNPEVQLDDDALPGGNPGGVGDVDPDTANTVGTLAGLGGDGALTFALETSGAPAGFTYVASGADILIQQGGITVVTVTLNTATGAYTVVQNAPVSHSSGGDENDVSLTLAYTVTDIDGDIANGDLVINIDDDTPVAINDSDAIAAGSFGPVSGNVITGVGTAEGLADAPGADGSGGIVGLLSNGTGASDVTADGSGDFTVAGQYGVLTLNQDGSYSYTRNAGTPGDVTDVFTYTLSDGDGDNATATLSINIGDLAPSVGANARVQLDDDALPGGNPGGIGDVDPDTANTTGTLAASGGDGALTFAFRAIEPPAGFTNEVTSTSYVIRQGGVVVLTATLDPVTGAYTVTQNAAVAHPAGNDENNVAFTLGYTVTDADGDVAGGTLVVDVDDDTPVAVSDSDAIPSGSLGPATGNVISGVGTTAGAAGADSPGADGGGRITGLVSNATGSSDTTADGGGDFTVTGQYGVLTINTDGTYSYLRNVGVPDNASDVFTYTLTDGDGDGVTATLTINIANAAPIVGANALVQLDDDALPGGNPGGVGDVDPDTANTTGTLAVSGGDGALTFAWQPGAPPAGFTYQISGDTLLIVQNGVTVVTATLDAATGGYTVVQNAAVMHAPIPHENNQLFNLSFSVSDSDGDTALGVLQVDVDDDEPIAVGVTASIPVGTLGPAVGNVITGVGTVEGVSSADRPGADGNPRIVGIVSDGTGNSDTTPDGSGNFVVAGEYGTLTINQDGSYSYARDPGTPGGIIGSFTYTLVDGDGDTATAKLTINIADDAPVVDANAQVQLDDDALPGGNPGGIGDVDPDTANTTGVLSGSGGDGALTFTLQTSGAPAGFTYVSSGNDVLIQQGGVTVVTVTLNTATGAYTVVQNAPVTHPAGGDENDVVLTLGYTVTDIDGDATNGSLVINVDDDTPVAVSDNDSIASGSLDPAEGNVITGVGTIAGAGSADSPGADGGGRITSVTAGGATHNLPDASGNFVLTGQHGVLTINVDGSYSYVRDVGVPDNAVDRFIYTLTDNDGDHATATLTITIANAAPVAAVNALVQLDDDALPGGNPGGIGDVDPDTANTTGVLSGSGGDGALTFALQTAGAPAGFTYVSSGNDILIQQGGVTVVTVSLDPATGAYAVSQTAPVTHPAGGDENNIVFSLDYIVTDADGDTATGNLVIDVDDDSPVAVNVSDSVPAGTLGPAVGNVITGIGTIEGPGNADRPGADGGARIVGVVSDGSGDSDTTPDGSGNFVVAGEYGTLTINQDGTYSYARDPGTPGGIIGSFTYTLMDGDGDVTTAKLTINIANDPPAAGGNPVVQLDDDALPGGNPGGVGDVDPDTANTTGTLAVSGGDGDLTFALQTGGAPAGFTYVSSGDDILIQQGGVTVVTITLDTDTGAYTVTQNAPVIHPAGGDENNIVFSLDYIVTDADGDTATGSLVIDVDDDSPVAVNVSDSVPAGTLGPAVGNVITGVGTIEGPGNADRPGADGGSRIVGVVSDGSGDSDTTPDGSGNFVVDGEYGTLTINQDGTYNYARDPGTPGGIIGSFTYTLMDGDGDITTAKLTINIADAAPVAAANPLVQLDDETLPGGNPGGPGDVDPDTANTTGTLSGSGGDGALTFALQTTGAPAGFTYVASGDDILIQQGGVTVVTVTLDPATGDYTVTQNAAVTHQALNNDEGNIVFALAYQVTDIDGDATVGSLVIDVDDDSPVAFNDSDVVAAGSLGPAIGNVISGVGTLEGPANADRPGADGNGGITRVTSNATGAIDTTADGAGNYTVVGQYGTLTLNQSGDYSYTRNAGVPDGARDVFTYTLADGDGDTTTATLTITTNNAPGPTTASNAVVQLDDDALPGGNPGGVGDVDPDTANTTGVLSASGGDGGLTFALLSAGAPAGFAYVASGNNILIQQGGITVVTVTLDPATGAYTVTQNAPVSHPAGGDENNVSFTLDYRVSDIDGDAANGSLIINVNDDTPVAQGATDSIPAGTFGPATGNVITGIGTTQGVADADRAGADGGGAIVGVSNPLNGASDTTPDASGNFQINGQYGVLTINQNGDYSYTRNPGTRGGVAEAFTYVFTDGDGDTVTATLSINIADLAPVVSPNAAVQLDDDALPGGNPGGVGDVDPDTANTTGVLSGSGGDGTLTFALQTTGAPAGFTYVASGGSILIQQDGVTVVTVALNPATGAYTITQNAPVNHPAGNDENDVAFTLAYRVTDIDGDGVNGSLVINVDDDTPLAYSVPPTSGVSVNDEGATVTANLNLPSIGADGPGVASFAVADGTPALDSSGAPLIFNGAELYYSRRPGDPSVLEARTSATPGQGELVYQIDLDQTAGTYTFTQFQQLSTASLLPVTNLSSVGGGNTAVRIIDVPNSPADLLLSTKPGSSINTNSNFIGVDSGNDLSPGDHLRYDFLTSPAFAGSNLVAGEYYSANSFRQIITNAKDTPDFIVRAILVVEAPGQSSSAPADGDSVFYGDPNDQVLGDSVIRILYAGSVIDPANYASLGISVTAAAGGGWRITGLPDTYTFEISSETPFQAVQIETLSATQSFKLGPILVSALVVEGTDFDVPIQYSDNDGDTVASQIHIDLAAPPTGVSLPNPGVAAPAPAGAQETELTVDLSTPLSRAVRSAGEVRTADTGALVATAMLAVEPPATAQAISEPADAEPLVPLTTAHDVAPVTPQPASEPSPSLSPIVEATEPAPPPPSHTARPAEQPLDHTLGEPLLAPARTPAAMQIERDAATEVPPPPTPPPADMGIQLTAEALVRLAAASAETEATDPPPDELGRVLAEALPTFEWGQKRMIEALLDHLPTHGRGGAAPMLPPDADPLIHTEHFAGMMHGYSPIEALHDQATMLVVVHG